MSTAPRVILLMQATRGFDRALLSGIARYAALRGPWTFYREPHEYLARRKHVDIEELKAWQPDGVFCPMARLEQLSTLEAPLIAYDLNEYDGDVPGVVSDDAEAGRIAARHLLDLGHRHYAFCGFDAMRWSRERQRAFCDCIHAAGFTTHVYRQRSRRRIAWAKEEPDVRNWLQSLPKPIGLLGANDDRAASILDVCRALGYSVPEDVSVIGIDDDQYVCELLNPALSSVVMASDRAGYEAAALLDRMMRGEQKSAGQRIAAHAIGVTARQSTNALMVGDPEVRKALGFIRENAGRVIRVTDVVRATGLSHRTLNDRFHRECDCSINRQLTRARVAHISRLLIDTDMPINEIAAMTGYENDSHFARYFKRVTGVSPLAYRRKYAAP